MIRTIGKYEILGMLGRGGMGLAIKCRVPVLDKLVAIKLLEPSEFLEMTTGMDELERRFTAEARMMSAVRHPNIAEVWDFGRDEKGRLYFVMEYLCNNLGVVIGETFEVEKPSRALGMDKAVDYALQTLDALDRLHFAGIVHRDVKPFNLLLNEHETVKLIDFGLSGHMGQEVPRSPGEKVGSPYYAAPEQEEDPDAADERSDLFSVGVMLFRMIAGKLPSEKCDPASACDPDLHADWDDFFHMAVHADPSKRFADAASMRAAIVELYGESCARREQACTLFEEKAPEPSQGMVLRNRQKKVYEVDAGAEFGLDELWRPLRYDGNGLEPSADGLTVVDKANNLVWQRSGSAYPMPRAAAEAYVRELNAAGFAGCTDWRLPTAPEVMTILTPPARGEDLCLPPAFDIHQRRIWTCDRRSDKRSWYADAGLGFIHFHDDTCALFVRAVRRMGDGA